MVVVKAPVARGGAMAQGADVHAGQAQCGGEHMPEGIVANLAHETTCNPLFRETHGHVGWGSARCLVEGRRIHQIGASHGGDEVDRQLTQTDGIMVVSPNIDSSASVAVWYWLG